MLSGVLLLRHIGEQAAAERVEDAIRAVIAEGRTSPTISADRPGRASSPTRSSPASSRWPPTA
jgi:isocitrate/isopropylmalate dehydrogenase